MNASKAPSPAEIGKLQGLVLLMESDPESIRNVLQQFFAPDGAGNWVPPQSQEILFEKISEMVLAYIESGQIDRIKGLLTMMTSDPEIDLGQYVHMSNRQNLSVNLHALLIMMSKAIDPKDQRRYVGVNS